MDYHHNAMGPSTQEEIDDDRLLDALLEELSTSHDFERAMQQHDFATAVALIEKDKNLLQNLSGRFPLELLAERFSTYLLAHQKKEIFGLLWAQMPFQQYCCGQQVFCQATSSYQQAPFETVRRFFEKVMAAQNIECVNTLWRIKAISHYYLSLPILPPSTEDAGDDALSFLKKVSAARCSMVIDELISKKPYLMSYLQGKSICIVSGKTISASPHELFLLLISFMSLRKKTLVRLMLSSTPLSLLLQGHSVQSQGKAEPPLPFEQLFQLLNKALVSQCPEIVNHLLKNSQILDFLQGATIIGSDSVPRKLDFDAAMMLIHTCSCSRASLILTQLLKNQEVSDYLSGIRRLPTSLQELGLLTQLLKDAAIHKNDQVIFLLSQHPLLKKLFQGDKIVFDNTGESQQLSFEALIDWVKFSTAYDANSLFTWLLTNKALSHYVVGKQVLWHDGSYRQIPMSEAMLLFSDGLKYRSKMITAYMLQNDQFKTLLLTGTVSTQSSPDIAISFSKIWDFFVSAVTHGDHHVINFLLKNSKVATFIQGEPLSCPLAPLPAYLHENLLTMLQKSLQHRSVTAIKALLSNTRFTHFLQGAYGPRFDPPITRDLYPFLTEILKKSFASKCFIALKPVLKNKAFINALFAAPHTVERKNQRLLLLRALFNIQEPILLELCDQPHSPIKVLIRQLDDQRLAILLRQLVQSPCENLYFHAVLSLVDNIAALQELIESYRDKTRLPHYITERVFMCKKRLQLLGVVQDGVILTSQEQVPSAQTPPLSPSEEHIELAPFLEQLNLALVSRKTLAITQLLKTPLLVSYLQGKTAGCVQGQVKIISLQEALLFFNLALTARNTRAIKTMAEHVELWPALTTDRAVFTTKELFDFFEKALIARSSGIAQALWQGSEQRLQEYVSNFDQSDKAVFLKTLVLNHVTKPILHDFLKTTDKALLHNALSDLRAKNSVASEVHSRLLLIQERIAELDNSLAQEAPPPPPLIFAAQKRSYTETQNDAELREADGIKIARLCEQNF